MKNSLGYEDPLNDPDNLLEAFALIQKWLKEQNCNISTGRFAEYVEFMRYMEECRRKKVLVPKYDMVQMATFNREIIELTFVFSRFVGQKTDLTKELLKKILQGHALPTEDPEAERCRNYLLQLRAAVYFMDLGFDVSVNADADVVAKQDGITYYVECKRLYSLSQVDKRFRELRDQLSKRIQTHAEKSEPFGIAWIDPTAIFLGKIGVYSAYTRAASQVAVRMDINLFANQCPFKFLQEDSRILATVLQVVWPSICASEARSLFVCFTSIVQPLVSKEAFRDQVRPLFDKLLKINPAPA